MITEEKKFYCVSIYAFIVKVYNKCVRPLASMLGFK